MGIESIVNVVVVTSQVGVTQEGFGTPLILSANAAWVERVRTYSSQTGVAADFATTTAEYKAAAAIFAQNPRVQRLKIGRLANKPTQRWAITPVAVNNAVYRVRVGANTASFTADGTATVAEITLGLTNAINALSGDTVTATDQTTFVRVTGNSAGSWDDVEILDVNLMKIESDHADPGVAADLDAIKLEDGDFYGVINPWNSTAMVLAIAAWTETNKKLYVACSQQTEIATVASVSATDIAEQLKDLSYFRTAVIYHPSNGSFADAAWVGALFPLQPGSETWNLKTLAGVSVVTLTETHETNIKAKNANSYHLIAGLNKTFEGKLASGEWIDVTRFLDWYAARLRERIFTVLAGLPKLPFTDDGIAVIESEIRGQNQDGINVGGIAASPAPVVNVPLASEVPTADKAARTLTGCETSWTLAGAIHAVNPINVTVLV